LNSVNGSSRKRENRANETGRGAMGSGKVFLTFNFYFSKYKQRYLINFMFI